MSALREVSNLANNNGVDLKQRQQASRLDPNSNGFAGASFAQQDSLHRMSQPQPLSQRFSSASAHSMSGLVARSVGDSQAHARRTSAVAGRALSSPRVDARHAHVPTYCADLIGDITDMFVERERQAVARFNEGNAGHGTTDASVLYAYYASPQYLQHQPEINEKMRMILIDWLIDVHLKFKLHAETMYLAVNLIDRYLSCASTKTDRTTCVPRAQLQLVGVSAMLLAAKYEEIWPPEVKECVHISANTYTREEIIKMERGICTALSFRLTVPTPFPFASRAWTVLEGDDFLGVGADEEQRRQHFAIVRHATSFFMEHALLDYKSLQFTPSQVAHASVFLALVTLRTKLELPKPPATPVWTDTLRHYTKAELSEFRGCAEAILAYVAYVPTTKYQAVRRKYNSSRYMEISKMLMPDELPMQ
ncbi:Cyc2-like cyclin putativecyclin [Leptomonas pyrrhocoris]|uniref:Cyc2-like cyclin putativecyclin n=1 Tax=Leptomonas pyrrhocoris TaxID=157538 RepID=A0A0N0DZ77_LEPPY|nr:Cyc2-like cyclin putativecyclin [Leptomonas pyrrhocoris]XP_015663411.1 Cyc2-like cyclin putativecyclin [Leptomonas pyrrhocoris]KPA84971.1 Cyc2-like cyclin putativecyclin [Leptomonas pyrrhocoris]KPA84972.1 Cyc2-like cyclin putativecyclin [Leptomonas pyrrhocoris]|eukprot:XP_015663410.1 Cyc2-like cyclin putativecyclin [Leptomonas pyrrhocoris]